MANKIRQHRPAFFEGFENAEVEFSTTSELLKIPFVKNFKQTWGDRFYRYSVDPGSQYSSPLLMCEVDEGKGWWVVGFLQTDEGVELPKWEPVREAGKQECS